MEIRDFNAEQLRRFQPPEIGGRTLALGLALLLAIIMAWTCVYTVAPEEIAVVLTFGRYAGETQPGLRFKLPYPIQTVIKVPVQRQLKQEFGFRTLDPGRRSTFASAGAGLEEALMLTGDLNVGVVEWTTQYRISDPYLNTFRVREIGDTFRDMNEAVMRTVIGDRSVTEVLTIGRQEIASEVERRLQELCDQYETGIQIEQIVLQDVNPPDAVKPSFNEVNQAQQERERMINEALAQFNREVPRASGEALQTIQEAEGYAANRVNRSEGDATRFEALLAAYRRAPEVTRRRIYLETMLELLPTIDQKIVLDEGMQGLIPLLSLGGAAREVQR